MDGLLLIDKPLGITSFDVIRRLRVQTGIRKIGHAGTLDPLTTGLMLMLVGSATKQAERLTKLDKRYLAHITLGANSTTGDGEGEKVPVSAVQPSREDILAALAQLTGEITQIPSAYSAIKIDGKEAYKRVRAGESVTIPPRHVTIYQNELIAYDYPVLQVDARVSSGTYIRSLAADLGAILGTGAYLSGLVRSEVGEYQLGEAAVLDDVELATLEQHLRDL